MNKNKNKSIVNQKWESEQIYKTISNAEFLLITKANNLKKC